MTYKKSIQSAVK